MLPLLTVDQALQRQRGHLLPWVPVCLSFGIATYFQIPAEPGWMTFLLIVMAMILVVIQTRKKDARALVAWAIVLFGFGFCVASFRANVVEAPVLSYRYYGAVEGRLISVDRSSKGALRITLDQVRLVAVSRENTPERLRITVSVDRVLPNIGARVGTTAHLMPPQGPAEPGGFDYRRYAWFMQLGANGYSRVPVVLLQPPTSDLFLQRIRHRLSKAIQDRIPGETGALAAAIITGDRSGLGQEVVRVLRASNLAHLLAISGLHMGLLSGFIYAAIRFGLCLCPPVALRWNVKKIAAICALIVAALYLGLSGGNVATERAFVMVCVALCAVLVNRRALSLRAVSVAAILVLLRRPESLLSPGFQMSFAATTALIAVFGWLRNHDVSLGPAWGRPIIAVLISSGVAGLATAPFAAAHFNFLSHYGLLANVLAVPVMGAVVVPSAVLSLCLAPFGLEGIALWLLGVGLQWILLVASWVSALPQAFRAIPDPGGGVIALLAIGGLIVVVWQGWLRWYGFVSMIIALALWASHQRPMVLISADGGLLGVRTAEGRALSRERGQAYAAQNWLRADGEIITQKLAAARWPNPDASHHIRYISVGDHALVHLIGKRGAELKTHCAPNEIVVSNVTIDLIGQCLVLQPKILRRIGSVRLEKDGTLVTSAEVAGLRLWTRPNHQQRPGQINGIKSTSDAMKNGANRVYTEGATQISNF